MEPINYLQQVADPFAQSLQGYKIGAGMADVEAKRAQAEQQRLATEKYNQALARLQSPTATAADFENMIMISGKDQAANIKTVMDSRSAQQNQVALKQVAPIAFALKTGNVEQGIAQLMQQAEAARNSGDTQEATYLTQLAEQAKTQPENIGNLFASKMVLIPGGKDALDNLLKMTQEGRAAAEAPAGLRQKLADASKAETQARVALETATGDIATADAKRKYEEARAKNEEVKAQYAVKEAEDAIVKRLADLGLTKAQTNEFNVKTRNLDTTGKLLLLDYKAAEKGLPLPSKNAGTTTTVGNATEDERKAAGWLSQANNAYTNMLGAMYTSKGKRTGAESPNVFEAMGAGKWIQGEERQKFKQAASSLSEALLRAATGAGVNEAEAMQKIEELTPTLFDTKGNTEQKLAAIPMYLQSLQSRAGRAAPPGYTIPTTPSGSSFVSGPVMPAVQTPPADLEALVKKYGG